MLRLILFYQRWVSPLLPPRCRFYPTCSEYAATAIQVHGTAKGSFMAAIRLCKCHPFCEGGYDPVPETPQGDLSSAGTRNWPDTSCCNVAGNPKSE